MPSRRTSVSDHLLRGEEESQGFSTQARNFYKATGKFLHVPLYKGEASEMELWEWKTGVEKYFETYGVQIERERVAIASDLLEGEAAKWWRGLRYTGRTAMVPTWEAMIEQLRDRFLPLEGEMKMVALWRRLQQTGPLAVLGCSISKTTERNQATWSAMESSLQGLSLVSSRLL